MATPAIQLQPSEIETLFKTVYADGVKQQQNQEAAMYKRFKKATIRHGGKGYEFPARMGQPQSIGMRTYRTALPVPQRSNDQTATVRQKYFYATGDITGPDLAKGKGNVNAFVNTYTDKLESITSMALKDLNFQFYLKGDGAYATVASVAGGATTCTVDTVKYLRADKRLDLWDDSTTTIGEASGVNQRAISALSIVGGAPTVTFKNIATGVALARDGTQPGGFALAAGDILVPETALPTGNAGVGMFFQGLGSIVDTAGVFEGIDRATFPQWRASVHANGGAARPLTLQLMQLAHDVPQIISGERITLILGSFNAQNLYQQLLVSQKRFMANKLDGGYTALDFNGKSFLVDVDCQDDRIYFLNEKAIQHFGLMDMTFDDTGGTILKHSDLSAGDVYYFFLKVYANFGSFRCNSHSVITDLEVDNAYKLAA